MFIGVPAAWLDILVALGILGSVIFGIVTLVIAPSLLRGKTKMLATVLFGASFLLGGADALWTRHVAERYAMSGTVSSIKRTGGKDPSIAFTLTNDNGGHLRLHANTSANSLQPGERIQADWMIFNNNVLHYTVLQGPHQGERFQDVFPFGSMIALLFGPWFIGGGYRLWRRDPMGHPQKRRNQPLPADVDDKSLLHLD
jgi:hypothetical protein